MTIPVSGDRAAAPPPVFEAFYKEQWAAAVRLAHLLTGVDAVAEDLAQDAFTAVHRHWDAVDNGPAYLRRAVVNTCRSWLRSRGREADRLRRSTAGDDAVLDLAHDDLLDAVDALPYRQKVVVVLRFYHDLPEAEIAAVLGCRPGTVKSLSSRALAQLRKVVER